MSSNSEVQALFVFLILCNFIQKRMTLLLVAFLVFIAWVYVTQRRHFKKYEEADKIFPGYPTVPLFGNVLQWHGDGHVVYNQILHHVRHFRTSYRAWGGPVFVLAVQTPEDCEKVTNNITHIKKSTYAYDPIKPWIGEGLLTSFGSKWRTHRKALTPAFHFTILEKFLDIFDNNAIVFSKKLEQMQGVKGFDVYQIVKLAALDNICESSMGVKINAQSESSLDYVQYIQDMLHIVFVRFFRPWYRPDVAFNLTKYKKMQKKALRHLHGFTKNVIKARIEERKVKKQQNNMDVAKEDDEGVKKKTAFLDILLDSYDSGVLTLDEVQEEVDTFMFEGHDTITSAMSFLLYEIAHRPECQEKLYQEITEVFGDNDRPPTTADLKRLKYLEMVVQETLRLYPSVPAIGRFVEEPLHLDEKRSIPAGTNIIILPLAIHHHPDVWEKPDEFYPEHFLPEAIAKRHPYAYIPFSAGPRNCIGMKFAMNEIKSTVSRVLRTLVLKPANPEVPLKVFANVLLQSGNGFMISVEKRK